MKRLALAIALFSSAALLSGCIIVPPRHGHRGYHQHYQQGSYDNGGHYHRGGSGYDGYGPRRR